jgi:hypothetical protein
VTDAFYKSSRTRVAGLAITSMTSRWLALCRVGVGCGLVLALAAPVAAQQTEDIEPRTVGGAGVTAIGVAGFIDTLASSEDSFPFRVTAHVEVTRFLTPRIAVRGGLIGADSFGGDDADDRPTGPAVPSLQASAAGLFYVSPESMLSFYAGGEYRAQLTSRADRDAGAVLGVAGVQGAVSSRVSVYVEGGYGVRLTRGDEDERQMRLAGQIGLRIKF